MRNAATIFACVALATTASAQVRTRIPQSIDNTRLVRVHGTTHPLANPAHDLGRTAAELPMDRMQLTLKSSPEQEAALEQLLVEQQDPQSANYHQWLTPEDFGQRFGASQEDLAAITNWLQAQGFQVNEVARGGRSIEFSGTARQVEAAFHTEMHQYLVDGEQHVANSTDVQIPEALAEVVVGVASLHDFHAKPLHKVIRKPGEISIPGHPHGLTNLSSGHGLSPYDFATIYDVAPLWNKNIDGTGVTIAIVADTNVKTTDFTAFRKAFGLSTAGGSLQVVVNGTNPGVVSGEETEADLDMEWAGAVAKGATIKLVVSANTNSTDGITLSSQYIVNNNLAQVMSVSYGLCEAQMGSENTLYNNLWSQAATQGITVLVAAGDSGSAGCDLAESTSSRGANTTTPASLGFGVNGLASTPYNVAVGGTTLTEGSGSYWNTSNDANGASAKSYIPEVVWNESSYTTAGATNNGLWAGGGGASILYPKPAWQSGTGVPSASHRYIPDVSLSAAGHDPYLVYIEGSLYGVGGTSAATPSMAGIMAMLVQYTGARLGNANLKLYPMAGTSSAGTIFHDITTGSNAVPCKGGSANCSTASGTVGVMTGFSATAGFDEATGWGSVDAYNLALSWGGTAPALTLTSVSPNPMTASSGPQTLTLNGSGFASNATVKLTSGTTVLTPAVTYVSSAKLTAPVTMTTAQTWTVTVLNGTAASNAVTLTVAAPPTVTSVSPNTMPGSSNAKTLTVNGTNFVSGMKVTLTSGSVSTTYSSTYVSATQVTTTIIPGTTAKTYTVSVTNPSGLVSTSTATLTVTAAAPAPTITSMTPTYLNASTSNQTLTINGTGFQSGFQFLMEPTNSNVVTSYSGSQVTYVSPTQVKVTVNVGTTKRYWYLQLFNADGQYTAINTIQVK